MKLTTIILAAGIGKRMKSATPKVMHNIGGRSMLETILATVSEFDCKDIRVVVSQDLEKFEQFEALSESYDFKSFQQKERLGTAHAVSCALKEDSKNAVLILYGDVPLISADTIREMIKKYKAHKADIVCLGFKAENPKGYGRLLCFNEDLIEIIEEKDATPEQRKINICNSGIYIINQKIIKKLLEKIENKNSVGEYYLTDIVKLANKDKHRVITYITDEDEVMGVNDRYQLSIIERRLQEKLRRKHLENGVTMIDPQTVYLSHDTTFGSDVSIEPNVYFGLGVTVASGAVIRAFSHIEGSVIGENSVVGPFARMRKGTVLGEDVKIGNFVETKAAKIAKGAKASHLSYLGDIEIGENANIGAGTIVCNYDGFSKHQTIIGKDTFIGSNTALVAPVEIGDNAIVGAGSTITENVAENDLSIARARQINFHQKAALVRKKKGKKG